MILLWKGEAHCTAHCVAGTPRAIQAPCLISVPPGIIVTASCDAFGTMTVLAPSVTKRLIQFFEADSVPGQWFVTDRVVSVALNAEHRGVLDAVACEIGTETVARRAGFRAACLAKMTELIVLAVRAGEDVREREVPSAGVAPWDMERVMQYVQSHFDEAFSLTEIADRCALNTSAFSREFKRAAGVPLFEYINTIRVHKACGLLKRSDKPVIEIALDVGYNNVSFFNRYFRRIMGMSPTQYRAAAQR